MTAPFELTDDSVVVVIGTGAGGGVLANELAQKGVSVVALEAGGRYLPEDYRERRVGSLRAALVARPAHDERRLAGGAGLLRAAGLDRQGGGRHDDPLGRREPALPGARVEGA